MIYSITLNLEQYEPRKVFLIKLSIFSWTDRSSKRRRIKLEDVMDIDHGKNYLNRERISHKCNQCEYTSFRRGSLRGHLKTHSGEKLNKCNQCDYASTQANTLRAHVNTHSGEKSNKLQPMYVCILLYQCFEDTFEKTQWRKAI